MEGSFSMSALKEVSRCTGKRPWLGDSEYCGEEPRTLQRGASNVHFSVTKSAISIPPWSEGAFKLINTYWTVLKHVPVSDLGEVITGMAVTEGTSYTIDDLVRAVIQRKEQGESIEPAVPDSLKPKEYEALILGREEHSRDQDFVCIPATDIPAAFMGYIDQVMMVTKLREVTALTSISRLLPPSPADDQARRAPLSRKRLNWLPAVEVMGEGVFIRLSEPELVEWESRRHVNERAARINTNYARKFQTLGRLPDREISARFIMVHTLAHVLINQWALSCGYPTASLRERLYISEEMAGLMIYTASGDAAGSLGGVVAQAEPKTLARSMNEALVAASWCSGDPLCMEADAAGVDSLNLAACHFCSLLPEISCEENNLLLDRALLIGTSDNSSIGYFTGLVN
jgi:hypothetical protein